MLKPSYKFYMFVDLRNKLMPSENDTHTQYDIDLELYDSWLKSPYSMEEFITQTREGITYFLFGESAVQVYKDEKEQDNIFCLHEVSRESHGVFAYNPIVHTPANLLGVFSGWAAFCEITEDDYIKLKSLSK
jgi:hypothetical protein